ncbi:AraJ, Arabinose efflux permease [Pyrenophora tritici-repentis]|nr:AraJ, Arabinose efflux permease [Pyrenophora tritici-repentis]
MAKLNMAEVWADIKTYRRAYLLTAVASFGGMLFGWDTGLIGGVLTMDAFQHSFNLDKNSPHFANLQGNIVSVLQAGCFFGALASFYVSDTFGRKWALIIADIIFILGSLVQTLSGIGNTNLGQLYAGRVIGGFGVGLISAVVPTYIGENAPRAIRGRCIGCMQLFNVTGICLSFFVNYGIALDIKSPTDSTKWRVPFALQILPGAFLLVGMLFMNESPRWLVEKNRLTDAAKALAHVRGKSIEDPEVVEELDEIIADFNGHEKMPMIAQLKSACSSKKMLYRSSFVVILMFWQQWTGTNSINYYAPQIFKQIGLAGSTSGLFATGVYGIVKIVVTAIGLMAFTEQLGRKWSLLIGSMGQAFAMYYIGINQAVHPPTGELDGNAIFAIMCVYLFVVFYSFGWGPIPFVLASECSPNHVRSLLMAASLMTQWLFNFVIAKITPLMLDNITYGTFLLFGSLCIVMGIWAVFCVPETKGVRLESIGELFEGSIIKGVLIPPKPAGLRRNTTYTPTAAPPLPPRPNSFTTTPAAKTAVLQKTQGVQVKTVTLSGATMDSRYTRPSSPRARYANPARSSTGTFADPYYDASYYGRPSSPRSSLNHLGTTAHHSPSSSYYMPTTAASSRAASSLKYDSSYTTAARPRRNTGDITRPNVSTSALPQTPLAPTYGKLDNTYITPNISRTHKKVYSVDDASHLTKLVAEVDPARHREHADRGYTVTSGGRSYHDTKPKPRISDVSNEGYSYTDPASMYRDTEPAWRRPRAGSLERSARPSSMIADRQARTSTRESGPPPSTRGFDKINGVPRSHGRSSSIERARDVPKYDLYSSDPGIGRSSSTRGHTQAATVHQEPRRDTYRDEYTRRDRDVENKRHSTAFEDRDVTSRGFGIAPGLGASTLAHDHHALDRQPLYPAAEPARARPQETSQYYQPERAEVRMPDPRPVRERDVVPSQDYDRRTRERENGRHEPNGFLPTAAGAATGAQDERDRQDRPDERRERKPEGRRNSIAPAPPPPVAPPVAPAAIAAPDYPPILEPERKHRDRRYEEEERERSSRKPPPPLSEGSGDERPRHYVDRDTERRRDVAPKEAALDPDEEYRRRIQQEAERASRSTRDRESDSEREKDRRRRKDERSRSRGPEERSRASPPRDAPSSRYDERSSSVHDGGMVQEPESLDRSTESAGKSVQIVEPPKEPVAPVKGILRKPTEKFPEDPEPIREGVAPHKDALKGKDIPVGARWTRIDRRLVNPEALEQAKERFEERMDCVIVLRVLTKEEIQKLADRTKKIRESRGQLFD